jgi:hypothetical protein
MERGGFVWLKIDLNLPALSCDQQQAPSEGPGILGYGFFGDFCMESVRPDNTDPIPLRRSSHSMGTILIRFIGLLAVAVVVLALIWSR